MAYIIFMVIIESAVFTRQITRLMTDDELARFQAFLMEAPDSGDVIPDGGGLRKIRWRRNFSRIFSRAFAK